jgi:hypothetical protein
MDAHPLTSSASYKDSLIDRGFFELPDHITLKTIRQKRSAFFKKTAVFTLIITLLLIAAGSVYLTVWLRLIWIAILISVTGVTFQALNRIYMNKMIAARNRYIDHLFPIIQKLSKEQSQFIISEFDYMFDQNMQEPLADLYKKLKTNNLTVKDIEKLNMMYSKEFVDLTQMNL